MIKPNESEERTNGEAIPIPEVALAKSVLVQAKQDLCRFAAARDGIGREVYADAYSWVTENDFSWPYSFQNVCRALRLSPDFVRAELLQEFQAGWFSRSRRIAQRVSVSLRESFPNAFGVGRSGTGSRRSSRPVLAH